MQLFKLKNLWLEQADPFVVNDAKSRITEYFILNRGDGAFLKFSGCRAAGPRDVPPETLEASDFLEANISVPIFSERLANMLSQVCPHDADFYPLAIDGYEQSLRFYICKIKQLLDVVDQGQSTFISLGPGAPILDSEVYRKNFDKPFYIARDAKYPSRVVVSELFKKMCENYKFSVAFRQLPQ